MDLVDEEHITLAELGEDRREVAGALERRSGGHVEVHTHLGGDDAGERGLSETGWAGEEQVISCLRATPRRFQDDP